MTEPVSGRDILAGVRKRLFGYRERLERAGRRVAIIRFDAPPDVGLDDAPAYRAAVTSARQKVLNFTRLGCNPRLEELPAATSLEEFAALVDQLNQDEAITGIIVQLPVPGPLRQLLGSIAPEKDIDALRPVGNEPSPYRACATAEGIFRIVEPFALEDDQAKVAVVGSRGFVGGSVMQLLDDAGIEHVGLDRQLGDDLDGEGAQEVLHRASIVVSTANRPSILDKRHLTANHRLVVDSAYIPLEDGTVLSTVAESARNTPKNLTPVPGGTGPVEMAILMERVVRKDVDPALPRWYFNPGQTQIVTWGSPSVAPQVAAADSRVVELEARKREGTLNYRELRELEALKKSQRLVAEDPSVEPPATPTVTLDPEKPEQAP